MTERSKYLTILSNFLAQRDVEFDTDPSQIKQFDVIILMANSTIESLYVAADLMKRNIGKKLLISGGIGHSTELIRSTIHNYEAFHDIAVGIRSEADMFADVLTSKLGIDIENVIIENTSTNCGTNAEYSRLLLDSLQTPFSRILLIQDPTMQRRSHACFKRAWIDKPEVDILSYAPFIPEVQELHNSLEITGSRYPTWKPDRFIALLLGEIPRLNDDKNGYGPEGRNYFDHVDLPSQVLKAYEYVSINFPRLSREIPK